MGLLCIKCNKSRGSEEHPVWFFPQPLITQFLFDSDAVELKCFIDVLSVEWFLYKIKKAPLCVQKSLCVLVYWDRKLVSHTEQQFCDAEALCPKKSKRNFIFYLAETVFWRKGQTMRLGFHWMRWLDWFLKNVQCPVEEVVWNTCVRKMYIF